MAANEIHLSDIGTVLQVTVKDGTTVIDVSSCTSIQFRLRRPDLITIVRTPSFVTNGTDGKLQYTIAGGDLSEAGQWVLQVHLVFANGSIFSSDLNTFIVYPNI